MNAHALQYRIAEAIANHVAEVGQRPIGRDIGVDGSTVGRWGASLDAWPLSHALTLAGRSPEIRNALIAFLNGEKPERGEAVAAVTSCREAIGETASVIGPLNSAVADNRIDPTECGPLLRLLEGHAAQVAQVIANLRAVAGRS